MKHLDPEQVRRSELAAIHCGRKELGLDEDAYRDLLHTVAGVRSAKDLDTFARRKVLDRMRELGAKGTGKGYPRRPPNMKSKPELTKIEALLTVQKLPWAYADGIAKQMFRVDNVRWCNATQLRAVITALVKRGERVEEPKGVAE